MMDQSSLAKKTLEKSLSSVSDKNRDKMASSDWNSWMCCWAWRHHQSHSIHRLLWKCPKSSLITDRVPTSDEIQWSQFRKKVAPYRPVGRTTIQSLQMEIFAYFLHFQAILPRRFVSPLKQLEKLILMLLVTWSWGIILYCTIPNWMHRPVHVAVDNLISSGVFWSPFSPFWSCWMIHSSDCILVLFMSCVSPFLSSLMSYTIISVGLLHTIDTTVFLGDHHEI